MNNKSNSSWNKRFRFWGNRNAYSGRTFEERVANYFRNSLKLNVKKNVILTDISGNKSEIDVCYGIFFKKYVECKAYTNKLVPLEDVAKFKEVLAMNGIPPSRGLFITTSDFAPRCRYIGIECWNGKEFIKREKRLKRFIRIFKSSVYIGVMGSLFLTTHSILTGESTSHFLERKKKEICEFIKKIDIIQK